MSLFDKLRNTTEIKHIEYATVANYTNRITDLPCRATVVIELNVLDEYPDWDGIDFAIEKIQSSTLEELCGHILNILEDNIVGEFKVVCQHTTSRGSTITATTFSNQHR